MMTSSVVDQKAHQVIFHHGFWKKDHDFLIVIHSNFLCVIHGFRDNEVFWQAGYDVIFSPSPGSAERTFSWRILNERPWLPDCVHSNFLFGTHGFQDNEIILQAGYDVIVIFRWAAFYTGFVEGMWKIDPIFIIMVHISRISYRFELIWHYILAGNCPVWPMGVFMVKHPQIWQLNIYLPERSLS